MAIGLLALALALPTGVRAQSAVESLVEQGRAAGADAALLRSVASRAESAGLGPEATADLLRPAVTLAEQGLPATPLLNKTLEGLAKRVPPGRMTPVLRQLRAHTQEAGALVSRWTGREDVRALLGASGEPPAAERAQLVMSIAEARQQNVPPGAVEQFLAGLPEAVQRRPVSLSTVATAVSVMPDLPAPGRRPEVSRELLSSALNAGYDPESIRQLPVALGQARQASQRPGTALARGAAQAIGRGTPAADVLKSLFQGALPPGVSAPGVGEGSPGTPPGQGRPPGQNGRPSGAGPPDDAPGNDPPGGGPPDDPPGGPPGSGT